MQIPRPRERTKERFRSLIPDEPGIAVRPMFGNLAAFVNGNMFTGLWGDELWIKLSDEEYEKLLAVKGARKFEPMKGRPMGGCIIVPSSWSDDEGKLKSWIARSLEWSRELPPKSKK